MTVKDIATDYFKHKNDSLVRFLKYKNIFYVIKDNVLLASTRRYSSDCIYECRKLVDTLNLSKQLRFNKSYRDDTYVDLDEVIKLEKEKNLRKR